MPRISRHFMKSTIADLALKLAAVEKSSSVKAHALSHARYSTRIAERDAVVRGRVIDALERKLAELMNDATSASVLVHDAWATAEAETPFKSARRSSKKARKTTKRVRTSSTTVRAKRTTASA